MTRSGILTLILLGLILLAVGWFAQNALTKHKEANRTPSAAELSLGLASTSTKYTDLSGNAVSIGQSDDELLVIHSWATWVPTSPQSLKNLAALQETYRAQDVEIMAINRSEPRSTATEFLKRIETGDLKIVNDQDDSFYKAIDGKTMPETIIFSREGDIVFHVKKPLTMTELDSYIDRALKQNVEIKN